MSKQDALRLRGWLQFTSGNVFGRVAKCSLAAISHHAYSSTSSKLTDDAVLALRLHRNLLSYGRPRELQPSSAEPWFIQTDACYDVGGNSVTAGVGAVLFTPAGKPILFLSQKLSYSTRQANRRQFSNVNSLHFSVLSCFGVTGLRAQLLSTQITTVFVTPLLLASL